MVFSNLFFLYIFLPANIILYFAARKTKTRNLIMVCFSLVFYAWGEPVWVFLLIATALLNWRLALYMESRREDKDGLNARYALIAAVVLDLSLLVLFKYTGFLYENINALFGTSFVGPGLVLPIGISFYTFQIISYMADVYRKDVDAQPSFLKFLMYVTMYHQLVAGPIVRYRWIAQEIDHREVDSVEVWQGLCRFCVGLCKKVVVANAAGKLAAQYLDGDLGRLTTAGALFGIPGVRGVSFGTGFTAAGMRGSEHNDPFVMADGRVSAMTNHAGGVLGGITSGLPLVVNIAVKPTASIAREQNTVDLQTRTDATLVIHGRHDPCIVPRAVPVAEAVTALTVLDMLLEE